MASKFPFIANEFNGKRALVTGGTAGIGRAVVSRLADGGASVITTARMKVNRDENLKLKFIQADLSTSEGCSKVVREVNSSIFILPSGIYKSSCSNFCTAFSIPSGPQT